MPNERSTAPGLHVETRAREQGGLLAGILETTCRTDDTLNTTRAERARGARVLFLTIRGKLMGLNETKRVEN